MFEVGHYGFNATDAARTFGNVEPWWFELTRDLDCSSVAAIGERVLAQAAAFEPLNATSIDARPVDEVVAGLTAVLAGLSDAAAILRGEGRLATSGAGSVAQLNTSGGGVPKLPTESVTVGYAGIEGDVQRTRVHHGRPWQALCLWSSEVIAALASDGHPVAPGGAGENVTISGLPWDLVRPGIRLRIGEVLCEASLYALPCVTTSANFSGGDFNVMHHERGPVSRMYATVLEPGRIVTGDPVELSA